jgi:hypothetical protein
MSVICRKIQSLLPQGITTELGPDATGVGWGLPAKGWNTLEHDAPDFLDT